MTYTDPGWRRSMRAALLPLAVPLAGIFLRHRIMRREPNALVALRSIYLILVESFFEIGVFLFLVAASSQMWTTHVEQGWTWFVVGGAGLYGLAVVQWSRSRPLKGETAVKLAVAYRGAFFIGVGMGEAPALMGFAASFIASSIVIFLPGFAFSLVLLSLIAPTKGDIERRQDQITAQGSPLSLGAALTGSPGA